jgi:hypothetical protein
MVEQVMKQRRCDPALGDDFAGTQLDQPAPGWFGRGVVCVMAG